MSAVKILKKKICLLGSFAVGKTSLIERFVYDRFDERYLSTLGVKVSQKTLAPIEKDDGELVQYRLLIWDIEGYDPDSALIDNYYRGAAGAILVADISKAASIEALDIVCNAFHRIAPDAPLIVAGNKIDLNGEHKTNVALLQQYAAEKEIPVHFTSAKTGKNVHLLFSGIAERL